MDEPLDISYYLGPGGSESLKTLDIEIAGGDIVSIDELPEDPLELVSFLDAEKCSVKYWILVLQAYSQALKYTEALVIAQKGVDLAELLAQDKSALKVVLAWIHLAMATTDRLANVDKAEQYLAECTDAVSVASVALAAAQVAIFRDQADVALQNFDKVLKLDASNCYALLGKAHITLSKTQNYTNALKLYQQVLVLNPLVKPDPRIGVGICFWFLKDKAMALNAWLRAVELDPTNYKAKLLLNLASFDAVFTNSLSDALFLQGYEAALKELTQLQLEHLLDNVILLALCSFFFSKQKFDVVEKIVDKVVGTLNSTVSGAKLSSFTAKLLSTCSFWLGRVAYSRLDFTQSQKYFHEAIRLNENNLLAKLGLGQSQLSRQSREEAIITFELILKTNPKCLEVNYSLGMLYAQSSLKTKQEQAVQMLERYIRLSNNRGSAVANKKEAEAYLNKEPIALNAFLTLSKLYESKDVTQSLTYLHKAIESRQQTGQDAPLEVYNNIAVFNFNKSNTEEALKNFDIALAKLDEVPSELKDDLKVSISYNVARTQETSDPLKAIDSYKQLLQTASSYFPAKLRLLFLDAVSTNESPKEDIEQEIKALLTEHTSNLEIRSFYGWFIKNFGKRIGLKPDADAVHQKQTLVEYDSHDAYALISLANIYCVMAKELKGLKEEEKRKKYYVRAIELYTKVLSIDTKNVFAAQGLAIVYIENKELTQGLDILRKIRDSLNDISVYLNLGHVLTEVKQYTKAVESYEIALTRFANGADPKILGFLGRAWYLRGLAEKNLPYLKKALECSKDALAKATGVKSSYIFNVAFIQFQIAEFITKQTVDQRTVEDINDAIIDLNEAIQQINLLASDEEEHAPFPKADLKARANLGTSTLLNRLNTCLEESEQKISQMNSKLEEAKKLREEQAMQRAKEAEEAEALKKAKEEELAAERAKLYEQAQQWAEESRANMVVNESDDDKAFDEETGKEKKTKKSKKSKGKKKKGFVNDSDEENVLEPDVESEGVPSDNDENGTASPKKAPKKGKKRSRRAAIEDDEDDDGANGAEEEPTKKKQFKSEETVQDSTDEEDGLF